MPDAAALYLLTLRHPSQPAPDPVPWRIHADNRQAAILTAMELAPGHRIVSCQREGEWR